MGRIQDGASSQAGKPPFTMPATPRSRETQRNAHACRNGRRLPEHRPRAERPADLPERAGAGRHGRAAGLQLDLVGRAPFHRLHDVPRRRAVPVLHGRPHPAGAAGLDGGGAALARSHARGRADLHARPSVGRPHDPRPGPRRRQGRVRGLPPRHGRQPRAVRRIRRGAAAGARDRRDGPPGQALPAAAHAPSAPRPSSRSAAAPMPRPSAPRARASWRSSASAC